MKKSVLALAVVLLALVIFMLSSCSYTGYSYRDSEKYSVGDASLESKITELDIDWIAGEVEINCHDKNTVDISEQSSTELDEDKQLHYFLDDAVLYIKYAKSGTLRTTPDKKLVINLPSALVSMLKITTVSADINILNAPAGVNVSEIETVSGNVKIKNSSLKKLEIETVSGNIDAAISLSDYDIEIESVSGEISLKLPEKESFLMSFESVSGKLNTSIPLTSKGGSYAYGAQGQGSNNSRIDIETTSGDLELLLNNSL